jgi:hypothetical protein
VSAIILFKVAFRQHRPARPVCEQVLSAEEQVAFLVACPVMSKPGKAKGHGQAADLGVELRRLKPKYETIIIDAGVEDAPTQRLIIT